MQFFFFCFIQCNTFSFDVLKTFFTRYIWANSFMSAISTFILFFVYFPLRGRKTYLGSLAGITERVHEKFIIETFSPGLHRQTLRRRKLWMTHVLKYYLHWTASREENFIRWEVYLSWNMWELYESGTFTMLRIEQFHSVRSVLRSNKSKEQRIKCEVGQIGWETLLLYL